MTECFFFYDHPVSQDFLWSVTMKIPESEILEQYGNDSDKLLKFCIDSMKDCTNSLPQKIIQATSSETTHDIIEFKDRIPLNIDGKTGRLWYTLKFLI